jgi:hypothetical protein
MRVLFTALCVGCSLLAATASQAATVQPLQGQVSINQGQGFQPINGAVEAKEGDSIIVSPGGSATVSYADGCSVGVHPGAVMVVAALSPCASGSYAEEQDRNSDWAGWAYGGVVLGVTGFVIYEIFQSTKTNQTLHPASP